MMSPELLEELKAALVRKEDARERWMKLELEASEAKAVALEAKKEFRAVCDQLEEIEAEIRTGLTGMPLVDAAKERDADDEAVIEEAAARFYRPPSKADALPVKPAKGSKRGASPAAVGAAAAANP